MQAHDSQMGALLLALVVILTNCRMSAYCDTLEQVQTARRALLGKRPIGASLSGGNPNLARHKARFSDVQSAGEEPGLIAVSPEVRAHLSTPARLPITSARRLGLGGGATPTAPPESPPPPPTPASEERLEPAPLQQVSLAQIDPFSQLYLDSSAPLEVYSYLGSSAYLLCRLRSIQQQDHLRVSWIRNMQILTSGELRYTSDERFKPSHIAGSLDWLLEISEVRRQDEGPFECQVNTEKRPASVSLYLHVLVPHIEILEGPELRANEDEQVSLTCRLEFGRPLAELGETAKIGQPQRLYIYWYKDGTSLEYNNPRSGLSIRRKSSRDYQESVIILGGVRATDQGSYTCQVVPELNELPPAETKLIVGSSSVSVASSSAKAVINPTHLFVVLFISSLLEMIVSRRVRPT